MIVWIVFFFLWLCIIAWCVLQIRRFRAQDRLLREAERETLTTYNKQLRDSVRIARAKARAAAKRCPTSGRATRRTED